MPRHFTAASSELVDCSLGAGGSLSGAMTIAAIVKRSSNSGGAAKSLFCIGTTNATLRSLQFTAADQVNFRSNNGASGSATITCTTTDGWVLLCGTKAAGSNLPRIHKYVYSSNTWTHANAAANVTDSTPTGGVQIAHGIGSFFDGDFAIGGTWVGVLTDAQIESLAFSLPAWFQVSPNGLWLLDQSSTTMLVNDLTGNGANQSSITGTSVGTANVPVFSYGAPIVPTQSIPITQITDTEAGSGADAGESIAATLTDADTASGADAESIAAALADADAASSADAGEAIAAAASDSDTATGADAGEAIAAALSDTESGTGADAGESVTVAISDSDSATAADAEALGVSVTDPDAGVVSEAEAIVAAAADADAAVIAEAEAIVAAVADAETALAVDTESVVVSGVPGCLHVTIADRGAVALAFSDPHTIGLELEDSHAVGLVLSTLGESTVLPCDD